MNQLSCESFINMCEELMIPAEEGLFDRFKKNHDKTGNKKSYMLSKVVDSIPKKIKSDVGNISDEEKREIRKQCEDKVKQNMDKNKGKYDPEEFDYFRIERNKSGEIIVRCIKQFML